MNVIYHSFLEIAREKESFLRKKFAMIANWRKERKGGGIKSSGEIIFPGVPLRLFMIHFFPRPVG